MNNLTRHHHHHHLLQGIILNLLGSSSLSAAPVFSFFLFSKNYFLFFSLSCCIGGVFFSFRISLYLSITSVHLSCEFLFPLLYGIWEMGPIFLVMILPNWLFNGFGQKNQKNSPMAMDDIKVKWQKGSSSSSIPKVRIL